MHSTNKGNRHHSSSFKLRNRQVKNVSLLKQAFESTINPFACRNTQLVQLVTQQVFPAEVERDVGRVKEAGEQMLSAFVKYCIETNSKTFWSPMKKLKLKTSKSVSRKVKVNLKGRVIEMKSNISLFFRLLIASRSRPEVDMKQCLSQYEFSTVQKIFFS